MKLIKNNRENFVFKIDRREKHLLAETLELYPLLDRSCHQLSRTNEGELKSAQKLLDDVMEEQRCENRKQLQTVLREVLLDEKHPFTSEWSLDLKEIEWLLQVLNDVRVGSWIRLGRPDESQRTALPLTENNVRYFGAMEIAGYFQMMFLQALDIGTGPKS